MTTHMTKLKGAALDRAVANALGLKSVHGCEKWGEHMNRIEEDDDIQEYKKPWVGLTGQEKAWIASVSLDVHDAVHRTEAKLKEKNA